MILKNKKFTIILVLVILIILVFVGYEWYSEKMKLVERGLADPKFPFHEYTIEELWEQGKWPEPIHEDVPTRTTPEETYAIFRQALIDGDLDKAIECFHKKKKEEYRDILYKAKEEGRLEELAGKLKDFLPGEEIKKGSTGETLVSYDVPCEIDGVPSACSIDFVKDLNGDWKIEDL